MKVFLVSLFDVTPVDKTRPMRYLSMAEVFIQHGLKVEYISNTFRHATKRPRVPSTQSVISGNGLKTTYLGSWHYKSNTSILRFISHSVYAIQLFKYLKSIDKDDIPDIIVSAMPPLFSNLVLQNWARRNNVKFYLDVIDPWPDVFLHFLPKRIRGLAKIMLTPHQLISKRLLDNATGVTTISKAYAEWAKSRSSKKEKLNTFIAYPSIDQEDYLQRLKSHDFIKYRAGSKTLNIVYAGNFGVSYDLPCILKAAKWFNDNYPGKTRFLLAGAGHYEPLVKRYVGEIPNVEYYGRVGFDKLMELYAQSHLGLAQYREIATQTFTYKFFDYMGSGLPLLNSLESETWQLIEDEQLGLNNKPGDFLKLAENIELFMNREFLNKHVQRVFDFTNSYGNSKVVYSEYLFFLGS